MFWNHIKVSFSLSYSNQLRWGRNWFHVVCAGSTPEVRNSRNPSYSFSISRYGLGLVPAMCALVGVFVTLSMKIPAEPTLGALREPLLA